MVDASAMVEFMRSPESMEELERLVAEPEARQTALNEVKNLQMTGGMMKIVSDMMSVMQSSVTPEQTAMMQELMQDPELLQEAIQSACSQPSIASSAIADFLDSSASSGTTSVSSCDASLPVIHDAPVSTTAPLPHELTSRTFTTLTKPQTISTMQHVVPPRITSGVAEHMREPEIQELMSNPRVIEALQHIRFEGHISTNDDQEPREAVSEQEPDAYQEQFASQLNQLSRMGFCDKQTNIRVLRDTQGDITHAIDILLQRP
jgi:hypothetical protein